MLESELTTECIAVQAGDQYLSFRRNNLSLHLFLKTKQNKTQQQKYIVIRYDLPLEFTCTFTLPHWNVL